MAAEWRGDDIDPESVVEDVHFEAETKSAFGGSPDESSRDAVVKVKKLKDELEKVRAERQEYLDGWQRSKADYVNLLKRGQEEAKGAEMKGLVKAVETILPAFDALERAKEHGEVPEGFQAIAKQIESAMASLGLEAVGQVGEEFDPALHEAYGQDKVASASEADKVTAVLEKGYKIGDKIIRPAKVKVGHFA